MPREDSPPSLLSALYWRWKNWLYAQPWYKCGVSRQVFLVGRYAVKFPITCYGWRYFRFGMECNKRECAVWRSTHSNRLARALFSFPLGLVLVMERAYVPRNFRRKYKDGIVYDRDIERRFSGLPYDPTCHNFGFIGRTMVLVDYGSIGYEAKS